MDDIMTREQQMAVMRYAEEKNRIRKRKHKLVKTRERYVSWRARLNEIKVKSGCIMCGETDPVCLDFHHRDPKEKKFNLGQSCLKSKVAIETEITKCDVICSNCHRKLERDRRKICVDLSPV